MSHFSPQMTCSKNTYTFKISFLLLALAFKVAFQNELAGVCYFFLLVPWWEYVRVIIYHNQYLSISIGQFGVWIKS